MREAVVIIGIGEIGGVFARGFLRAGHPVFPILRDADVAEAAEGIGDPEAVLVAVRESDLAGVLGSIPDAWRDRVALLQNELLPRDWRDHRIVRPTVVVVWFEKKKDREVKVILPSLAYGPRARLVVSGLGTLEIPALEVQEAGDMLHEMVRKNLYILTSNIAGLVVRGTTAQLWIDHRTLVREIANEILDIQEWLARESLPRERMIQGMIEAFRADPEHVCLGRSARERLERAIRHAGEAGLATPRLREIQAGLK